jgi:NAD(P)-dependent dehydrogenase (short-subunit alcohol dehydrogenase family)
MRRFVPAISWQYRAWVASAISASSLRGAWGFAPWLSRAGRSNSPDDIANMACFLASAEADNITGQSFNVDGGLMWD